MLGGAALTVVWAAVGFGFALTQTPIGRLLVRSARDVDRPSLYAAQFALSHACWLLTYPLAGWLGAMAGLPASFAMMACTCRIPPATGSAPAKCGCVAGRSP